MTVDTFDPGALGNPMDAAALSDLCAFAREFAGDTIALSELEVARFAGLATHADWSEQAQQIEDEATLAGLIRVFTLGEMSYPSWTAGERSPVVVLVKELKRRGAYDVATTRWIKANTTNRFLPHGSLMDRL